jgi:hypothetical protein
MRRGLRAACCGCIGLWLSSWVIPSTAYGGDVPAPKLLLAISTYAKSAQYPQIVFYEHDGVQAGQRAGEIPAVRDRSDHHPCWTGDGQICWFAAEKVAQPSVVLAWNRVEQALIEAPQLNNSPHAQGAPSVSLKGDLLIAEAWSRPQFPGRWDLVAYRPAVSSSTSCLANDSKTDERHPALSGDGKLLAFVTNNSPGGDSDVRLWDLTSQTDITPPMLNSPAMDTEPQLSADGRWLVFASDRREGLGGRDLWLFDRQEQRFVELNRANTVGQEQSPSITADGRYLAYVGEPLDGAGERDVLLYDIQQQQPLPAPGLNSPRDEFDPALLLLP